MFVFVNHILFLYFILYMLTNHSIVSNTHLFFFFFAVSQGGGGGVGGVPTDGETKPTPLVTTN